MEKELVKRQGPTHMDNLPAFPKGIRMKVREDRVLVLPCDPERKSSGGIIIPDTAQERPHRGIIVAVGPGTWEEDSKDYRAMDLKPGDVILYGKYSGNETSFQDEDGKAHEMLLMRGVDVAAIIY